MTKPLLLDTCAAFLVVEGVPSKPLAAALLKAHQVGVVTYVSPITAWEIGTLAKKGRFKSNLTPLRWFERLMSAPRTVLAELTPDVLIASSFLPSYPGRDAADRIIAASAREYGFTVVTSDAELLEYGSRGYLDVLEC